jgi:hypothetical protein
MKWPPVIRRCLCCGPTFGEPRAQNNDQYTTAYAKRAGDGSIDVGRRHGLLERIYQAPTLSASIRCRLVVCATRPSSWHIWQ